MNSKVELPTEYQSLDEFYKKGEELFGTDKTTWKFICPSCKKVTQVQEWLDYAKSKEEAAGQIAFSCVGRLIVAKQRSTDDPNDPVHQLEIGQLGESKYACNYTTGGLFNLSPVKVTFPDSEGFYFFQFHV